MNNTTVIFSAVDADLGRLHWRLDVNGYARRNIWDRVRKQQRPTQAHHIVLARMLGGLPDFRRVGLVCDHINRIPHDNRRTNLRLATYRENVINRKGPKWTGAGITWHKCGRWQVAIRGKYFGLFKTKKEALERSKAAILEMYGDLARRHAEGVEG